LTASPGRLLEGQEASFNHLTRRRSATATETVP
jgi:hypothetical protein